MPLFLTKMRGELTAEEVAQCASLFSSYYGVRGSKGPRPGHPVSLTTGRLLESFLYDDQCGVVLCKEGIGPNGGVLLGHALFRRFWADVTVHGTKLNGPSVWVTQLVVEEAARSKRLATTMLLQLCTRDLVAMGLLSCHPHAVRALSRACARPCVRAWIAEAAPALVKSAGVPYFQAGAIRYENGQCMADTGFFVDHTEVNAILNKEGEPQFELGSRLEDGHEFIAIAFPNLT